MDTSKIRIRVSALLRDSQNRLLLVNHEKNNRSYWMLPGGGLSLGETIPDCFKREMKEEMALNCEIGDLISCTETIYPNGKRHIIHMVFTGNILDKPPYNFVSSDERVTGARFFSKNDLKDLDFYPDIMNRIIEFMETEKRKKIYTETKWLE